MPGKVGGKQDDVEHRGAAVLRHGGGNHRHHQRGRPALHQPQRAAGRQHRAIIWHHNLGGDGHGTGCQRDGKNGASAESATEEAANIARLAEIEREYRQ